MPIMLPHTQDMVDPLDEQLLAALLRVRANAK